MNFVTDALPPAEAYVLGHILHFMNDTVAEQLLTKIYGALSQGTGAYRILATVDCR